MVHDVAYVEGGMRNRVAASRRRDAPWRRWSLSVVGEIPSDADGVHRGRRDESSSSTDPGRMAWTVLSTTYLEGALGLALWVDGGSADCFSLLLGIIFIMNCFGDD